MSKLTDDDIGLWIARHALLVWLGIVLNLFFVIPLLFKPEWILGLFNLPLNQLIWGRFSGLLLLIITVFYVPATIDFDRYRVFAWLAVFPSRSFGAIFFFLAVFVFGEPPGFIVASLLDGSIGLTTLFCLIKITKLERAQRAAGEAV